MKIGELSKRTGISVRMLRYYESKGLLHPARRASGYRDYSSDDEKIAKSIRLLILSGLKVDFIRRFLPCIRSTQPILHPCPELMSAIQHEINALDRQILQYQNSKTMLEKQFQDMRAYV